MKNPAFSFARKCRNYFLLLPFMMLFLVSDIRAQRPDRAFGIGFQAGNPTGLSLQFYRNHGVSTDILFAHNFNRYYYLNVHGLWNTHLDQNGHVHFFYGPGGFVGVYNNPEGVEDRVTAGISGNFGLNLVLGRLEFFGQVTPRMEITNATHFDWGYGAGIRFYF